MSQLTEFQSLSALHQFFLNIPSPFLDQAPGYWTTFYHQASPVSPSVITSLSCFTQLWQSEGALKKNSAEFLPGLVSASLNMVMLEWRTSWWHAMMKTWWRWHIWRFLSSSLGKVACARNFIKLCFPLYLIKIVTIPFESEEVGVKWKRERKGWYSTSTQFEYTEAKSWSLNLGFPHGFWKAN